MKKSEMVKALADNFCHAYEIEIHAETIIDFLISQGMQPPSYVNGYFTAPYLGCDSADVEWVEETVNDWEPE